MTLAGRDEHRLRVSGIAHRSSLLKNKGRENYRSIIIEPRLGAGEERRCTHMPSYLFEQAAPANLTSPC